MEINDLSDLVLTNKLNSNELSEETDQFRFLRTPCFANLKGAVGLIITKTSDMLYGFQSPLTFHLGHSYLFLVSSVDVVPHRLYLIPSYFLLPFFILLKINTHVLFSSRSL